MREQSPPAISRMLASTRRAPGSWRAEPPWALWGDRSAPTRLHVFERVHDTDRAPRLRPGRLVGASTWAATHKRARPLPRGSRPIGEPLATSSVHSRRQGSRPRQHAAAGVTRGLRGKSRDTGEACPLGSAILIGNDERAGVAFGAFERQISRTMRVFGLRATSHRLGASTSPPPSRNERGSLEPLAKDLT